MKIDDSTFFFEKMGQDLSYNLYSEIFFFVFEVTRQVTLVNSGEMQSSSSGIIKRTHSIFFLKRWSKNV